MQMRLHSRTNPAVVTQGTRCQNTAKMTENAVQRMLGAHRSGRAGTPCSCRGPCNSRSMLFSQGVSAADIGLLRMQGSHQALWAIKGLIPEGAAFRIRAHTQLLIQGQWWSMRSTQRRHTRQWCARGGLWRAHFWQKRASPLCTRRTRHQHCLECLVCVVSTADMKRQCMHCLARLTGVAYYVLSILFLCRSAAPHALYPAGCCAVSIGITGRTFRLTCITACASRSGW